MGEFCVDSRLFYLDWIKGGKGCLGKKVGEICVNSRLC